MVAAAETVVASSSSAEPIEVEGGGVMNGNASDERAKRPRFEYLE
jgi:hypothetical protein